MRRGFTRRQWLAISAVASGRLLPWLSVGCDAPPGGLDSCGPVVGATFEVDHESALVSVVGSAPGLVEVVMIGADGDETVVGAAALASSTGLSGAVWLGGLAAATRHAYYLRDCLGQESPRYRFTTAPSPEQAAAAHFLFSADVDVDPAFRSGILPLMAATGADFFLCLGDFPYADNPPGAMTIEEYRVRHRLTRSDADVQALLQAMATFAIYDDHEVRNDWDARFREIEAERVGAALQVWAEHFPLRQRDRRYRSWRWGSALEIFLLDTRLYRADNRAPDDASKSMLGAEQKAWLLDGLAASGAAFKLVATSVPLDFGLGNDGWWTYTSERDEILGRIRELAIPGVLFLSADQHWFAAHHLSSGFVEYQVGPVARGLREMPAQRPEEVARASTYNFGEIEIALDPVRLVFRARDATGAVLYRAEHLAAAG